MSINGALNSAVSGLNAQSTAMAIISDNLANSDTYGYKANSTSFSTLVTSNSNSTLYSSGGVRATPRQAVDGQGLIVASTSTTDMAIDGGGFFPVTDSVSGEVLYFTRNGQFSLDSSGNLVNGDYYLQGWELDSAGNIISDNTNSRTSLTTVNLSTFNSHAEPTTEAAIQANLPANAEVGDAFTSAIEVYDSLGTSHTVTATWEKTAENEWSVSYVTDDSSATVTSGSTTLTFDSDGLLSSIDPDPSTLEITGWSSGAADSSIAMDFGTAGKTDGMTQYASADDEDVDITLSSIDTDGLQYGTLSGVEVDDEGIVYASYDNGAEVAIYQIPVATFTNPNGLSLNSGGVYEQTYESGDYTLGEAGTGSAGSIEGGSLESSTVDTATEFSKMIVSQQAYSAASQIITACNDMYDSLLSAVR